MSQRFATDKVLTGMVREILPDHKIEAEGQRGEHDQLLAVVVFIEPQMGAYTNITMQELNELGAAFESTHLVVEPSFGERLVVRITW